MVHQFAMIHKFVHRLISYLPAVDPVIFGAFFGLVTLKIADSIVLFQIVCYYEFAHANSSINCWHIVDRKTEATVHQAAANWTTLTTVAILGTSFVADLLLGAWGDRCGRQYNMLSGFVGMIGMSLVLIITNTFTLPPWVIAVAGLFAGATGFIGIVPISCYAYLADTVSDKRALTARMMILAVSSATASLLGSTIVGTLSASLGINWVLVVGQATLMFGLFWAMGFVKQISPTKHKKMARLASEMGQRSITSDVVQAYQKANPKQKKEKAESNSIASTVVSLLKEAAQTFAKKRDGNRRAYLLILIPCFVVHSSVEIATHSVLALYVIHSPFYWNAAQLGYFNMSNGAANLFGIIFSVAVFQRTMKLRDSTLCLISIISNFGRMLLVGVAPNGTSLYVANILGLFSHLMMPAVKGLAAKFVEPHEIGKIFTGFALSIEVGVVLGSLVYTQIYNATLRVFIRTVWFFICGLLVLAFLPVLWIHYDSLTIQDAMHQEDGGNTNKQLPGVTVPPQSQQNRPPENPKESKRSNESQKLDEEENAVTRL